MNIILKKTYRVMRPINETKIIDGRGPPKNRPITIIMRIFA